jgi:AAA15 family ATPase/GTPase
VIKGFGIFQDFIFNTNNYIIKDGFDIHPYLLELENLYRPIKFEIIFKHIDVCYKYGFAIDKNQILGEYLITKKVRDTIVFTRNKNEYKVTKKYVKMLELVKKKMIPNNSLLITKASEFNEDIAINFISGLEQIHLISGIEDLIYKEPSLDFINNQENKKIVLFLLKIADSTINNVNIINNNIFLERNLLINGTIKKDRIANFPLDEFESEGTKKLFNISRPIINTLFEGQVLFIDELDTKLHPLLIEKIIELFNNPVANPKNAQLIFTTHNTSLLSAKLFRRDQIWLTEKNEYGVSDLYSLADFKDGLKGIRNDESIEKNYLTGKYGGIPFLGDFDNFKVDKE